MNPPGAPLTAADLAAFARCGIPRELAERALVRRVDSVEGAQLVGRTATAHADYAGLVFPYLWPGENYPREYRLRRDHPDLEVQADGLPKEKAKYVSPPAKGNLLYFPPSTSGAYLLETSLPILVAEGEKKTLALWALAWHDMQDSAERPRWLPVGIAGVWSWRGVNGKVVDARGERRSTKGPIGDLNRIQWTGRKVTVLFDTNVREKPEVQAARWELSKYLRSKGAQVHWFEWPANTPAGINGIDDLSGQWGPKRTLEALSSYSKAAPLNLAEQQSSPREFSALAEDRYTLALPALGIVFDIDRLRRDHHELIGELTVRCALPGARTYDGVLSAADFNLSSARARSERAKLLAERAKTNDLDWPGLMEEFTQRVIAADRQGQPAASLRDLSAPEGDREWSLEGLALPREHPAILFGDGGAGKSYLALYLAGCLARAGVRVALFDWELAGEDHRERLERLFGRDMPEILYARCERPLSAEADRLRRIVRERLIQYCFYDSVAFACDGPPEAAEVAARYFRAARQIGGGSLHVAHINKSDDSDRKPFGSTFWHNGARATWFLKASEEARAGSSLDIALFHRKANLGPLREPVGFRITFAAERTTFQKIAAAADRSFAERMTCAERMSHLLRGGSMTVEAIAEELDTPADTVRKTARRHPRRFVVLDGGKKLGLFTRAAAS